MLHEGYGDELLGHERLLRLQVAERTADHSLWDDLLNEARLTAWRLRERPRAYVHAATRKRITELLTRQTWTGHTRVHGQPTDPLRQPGKESLDDPDFTLVVASAEWMESVSLAYHHGEIFAAIAKLQPNHRAYVILRFWGQWTPGEIAPVIGVKATNQARMWKESIQPILARELAHLG